MIDRRMWTAVLLTGVVMAAVTLLTIDLYLPQGLLGGTNDLATARTASFTVLVLAQLINSLNCRSETVSTFDHVFVNPWLWAAIALPLLLQVAVVNLGFLNTAFGTSPLSWSQWLTCLAMASAVLWFGELRKLVLPARVRPHRRPRGRHRQPGRPSLSLGARSAQSFWNRPGPATLRHDDAIIGALRGTGFSVTMTAHTYALLDSYIYGFALSEAALPINGPDTVAEVAEAMMQQHPSTTTPTSRSSQPNTSQTGRRLRT